jgi:hypothetical protein
VAKDTTASRKLLDFLTSNADKPWTVQGLVETTGLDERQVPNAFNTLTIQFPKQAVRKGRGVYIWLSRPEDIVADEFIVKVVARKPDRILVMDEQDRLFVMTPLADF